MRRIIIAILIFIVSAGNKAAADSTWTRYIGFDANPLLSQVLPLNRVTLNNNVFAITMRRYWGNNGIRAGYGVGLGDVLDVQFFQFMFGYDHRRKISPRWAYFNGLETMLRFTSEENTNGSLLTGDAQGLGIGGHWGVEFFAGKVVSISTEASLRLLVDIDEGDASFLLLPPVNLTAHFNISKK